MLDGKGIRQFSKYVAVQVLAYGVEWAGFLALRFLSQPIFLSNVAAKFCALLLAFLLHRSFTFEAQSGSSRQQITRYFALGITVSILSSWLLLGLDTFLDEAIAKLLSDLILIVLSFLVSKLLIFRAR